jgi:hypothetical protein
VDITGKWKVDGSPHQTYIGTSGYMTGWQKTYGGTSYEYSYSMVQAADGGYAIAGYTDSFGAGHTDFYLVKTDASGDMQWNKTYGGTKYDYAYSVVRTADGGYAMAGCTTSFGINSADFYLVKTDATGNLQWNKTYTGIDDDIARSVVQTADGGYAMAGYTYSFGVILDDFYLVKTNAAGNMQWNKTYGGTNYDQAYSVVQTSDGGYAMAGRTQSYGAGWWDLFLVKTDVSGNLQWNKTYGTTQDDEAYSVVQTADGGYAIAGFAGFSGGGFYLVKTDASGNAEWSKAYGGIYGGCANCVIQTTDAGYALAGYTGSPATGYDFHLVKTDASGNLQWKKTYAEPNDDRAGAVVQTVDDGYVMAGFTNSFGAIWDFCLIKADVENGLCWSSSTPDSIQLYRGVTDQYWNFVRVRIWKIKETP